MKSDHQQRIEKFMHLAGQDMPVAPTTPSEEVRILRAKLILEEALETIYKGLGVYVLINNKPKYDVIDISNTSHPRALEMVFQAHGQFNMEETIDGCCDLSVVTIGTLSTLGVPDKPFLEEVDNNNLAKFGPGGYRNDYGKWVKPPGHKPPDINRILSELTLDHHDTEENPRG
jgi:predicted HAD superfamily Cof-like phosphohydrolase